MRVCLSLSLLKVDGLHATPGGGDARGGGDAWLLAECDEPDCLCLPPGACAEANARLCTPFQMGPACPPR